MINAVMQFRREEDTMGAVSVPANAYYGAQTQRAAGNFAISDLRFPRSFIKALGLVKKHAATANTTLGLLNTELSNAIITAADEVMTGRHDSHFIIDIFQTGSGTSTNMNTNEVIAGRANEILGGGRGGKTPVHPNDHVNLGQSSNDVIPTAIHISSTILLDEALLPNIRNLRSSLHKKSREFQSIRKIGRTHLRDAVPISLGQEFSGYSRQIDLSIQRLKSVRQRLTELALGGTAVGTGTNTHPQFAQLTISGIAQETGLSFVEAQNHFAAQAAQDSAIETSGALKVLASALTKICNDIRWLSSGPRCGIGEIEIPSLQPGSSIMPGKVNPVIPEAVLMAACQVVGNDTAITWAGSAGNFELNVMLPVIAYNLLQSLELMTSSVRELAEKCVDGITANREKCRSYLEESLALATALAPAVGYDQAAQIAKKAYREGKTIRETAHEIKILPAETINQLLDSMIEGSG